MMRKSSYFLGLACLLLPSLADAQPGSTPPGSVPPYAPAPAPAPYYGPNYGPAQPPAPPPQASGKRGRHGWNFGFGVGLGGMESDSGRLDCATCDNAPPAFSFDIHVGYMLSPKLALLGEFWFVSQGLDSESDVSLDQNMGLIAAQYWLSSRLWIKGGFGVAGLEYSSSDAENVDLGDGSALMGAVGYEIIRSGGFAMDIQLKTGLGNYSEPDEQVAATEVALGFHWY